MRDLRGKLMADCVRHEEFKCISVDATLRCCLPVMGQGYHRASASARSDAAFGDAASLRKVLTVRGRTGACPMCRGGSDGDFVTQVSR